MLHTGKTYNLNGPEPLSGTKAGSVWSKLLGKEIRYAGDDMDAFEEQMRKWAPLWSAFDIRMMFKGYLERGFVAETEIEKLTKLLGHGPPSYEDLPAETAANRNRHQTPKNRSFRRTKCHLLCHPSLWTIQNAA